MRLEVHQGFDFDNYKDVVRIHSDHRKGIRSGRIAKVWVTDGGSTIAAVRGLDDGEENWVRMDLETRRRLDVKLDNAYEFNIRKAGSGRSSCGRRERQIRRRASRHG